MALADNTNLPRESGITTLTYNNSEIKILTVRQATTELGEDKNSTELVHIPLINIAKTIFFNISYKEYEDSNGNKYLRTFTGADAVQSILTMEYATNSEDAVDYLSQMMDEE
eukprot:413113_1